MHDDTWVLGQPGLHGGVLVGGVVVYHDVQFAPRVGLGDMLEELQELVVSMPRVAGIGHLAGRDFQRREQGRGAVPDIVVGLLLRITQAQQQTGAVRSSA